MSSCTTRCRDGPSSANGSPTTKTSSPVSPRGCKTRSATLDDAQLLKHGTTHVINAFIQRTGSVTALVTTRGFRDILEIARGNRAVPFDLGYRRHAPLVPRSLRLEVGERVDAKGEHCRSAATRRSGRAWRRRCARRASRRSRSRSSTPTSIPRTSRPRSSDSLPPCPTYSSPPERNSAANGRSTSARRPRPPTPMSARA